MRKVSIKGRRTQFEKVKIFDTGVAKKRKKENGSKKGVKRCFVHTKGEGKKNEDLKKGWDVWV